MLGPPLIALTLCFALCSASALSRAAPTEQECETRRQIFRDLLDQKEQPRPNLAVQTLAESDVALVTEPVIESNIDMRGKKIAKITKSCTLKGDPGSRTLTVRLLPTGTECVNQDTLEDSFTHYVNRSLVFMLRKDDKYWDLVDGGLYTEESFFKQMNSVCNVTGVYKGSCRSGSSDDATVKCTTSFHELAKMLQVQETPPYTADPPPPKKQPSQDAAELVSDQPASASGGAKRQGGDGGGGDDGGGGNGASELAPPSLTLLAAAVALWNCGAPW